MSDSLQFQHEELLEPQPSDSGFNVWQFLLRRKWVILFGVVVGLGLGYLYLSRQPPVYKTSSRVMLVRRQSNIPIPDIAEDGQFSSPLATHMIMIRSPMIVGQAIEEQDLNQLGTLAGRGNPVKAVIDGLEVESVGSKADVLQISFTAGVAEDCQRVVEAVTQTYLTFVSESQQNVSQETVELISEANDVLLKQLREKEAEYREFRQEAPLLWTGERGTNVPQSRLQPIEAARADVLLRRSQIKAEIESIEAALKRGGNREALMLMVSKSEGAGAAEETDKRLTAADKLFPLLLEEQMLLEDFGPDHPKILAVRKRISFTRDFVRSLQVEQDNNAPRKEPADFLTVYLQSLREELQASAQKEQEYNDLFESQRDAAKDLSVFEVKDQIFRDDIARTQRLFESVVKRLEEVNLIKDYGNLKADVLSAAGPAWKVGPNGTQILSIAGMLGLLAGVGMAYLIELADKSFRSPEDIAHRLLLPVVGHVPLITPARKKAVRGSAVDPILSAFHQPKSRTSEAFRGVRTSLYFSVRGSGHKVIQVTSPNPGDGKTTLAGNLAVSIAQSGKKTLLMDCDCRRPRVHKLFGLERGPGLTDLLQEDLPLGDVVQQSEMENLFALSASTKVSNPSELLTSPRFEELLQQLREEYEFVVVDTPPLLAVTDPSVVAARADGVLLTLRLKKNGSVDAVRANEVLAAVGATTLGVVVNGVGGKGKNGYGYGRYGYGSQYGYGSPYSGYGSGYGYSDDNHYYSDDEAERLPANGQPAVPNGRV